MESMGLSREMKRRAAHTPYVLITNSRDDPFVSCMSWMKLSRITAPYMYKV